MILLIDIGNTRIKWAELSDAGLGRQSALAHQGLDQGALLNTTLNTTSRPSRVLVSNVGGVALAQLLRDAVAKAWQIECEFIQSGRQGGGILNAYPVPTNLGVDRWLGMIAAHAMYAGSACVVGVGTAMTVDGLDGEGVHLGGLIVPGPDLMVSALLRNTSEIARRAASGEVRGHIFADNTLGAIEQGSAHALAALIERALVTMRRQHLDTTLVLTGGASARVASLLDSPHETVPDLVLRGLAVLASGRSE